MKIAEALALRGEPDSYERQENAWLLEHLLNIPLLMLKLAMDQELTGQQQLDYLQALHRLKSGEPLAYITGSQPFWTLDLNVTTDTLVPRPDTEILVETVLNLNLPENASIVDLGTGTGAIALSLASERPAWSITATDIHLPALKVAQGNAEKYAFNQVSFCCGAWYAALSAQKFDLIVSNPPYIDAADQHMKQLACEPERALVAADRGLSDIDIILDQGRYWLNTHGWIALEHGYDQGIAVRELFERYGFSEIKTVRDYGGNERVTLGQHV
ncbi:peptide chain release factor N(5)-glutamine methyltransferase [Acinetobacter sp. WZC-1]|uniref:peptide chain release factor N(5)-glutamine methyltransferase n=1 Tax=Acinetobacter sp. WZC-1 TaxID=3459034 RepID=UPI00403E2FD5